MAPERLEEQIRLLLEADKLKRVSRRTLLTDGSRRENSAEHSWRLAVATLVLEEYATASVNLLRIFKMIAIHDLVEIDADDTFAYDSAANATKQEREQVLVRMDPVRTELPRLWPMVIAANEKHFT